MNCNFKKPTNNIKKIEPLSFPDIQCIFNALKFLFSCDIVISHSDKTMVAPIHL